MAAEAATQSHTHLLRMVGSFTSPNSLNAPMMSSSVTVGARFFTYTVSGMMRSAGPAHRDGGRRGEGRPRRGGARPAHHPTPRTLVDVELRVVLVLRVAGPHAGAGDSARLSVVAAVRHLHEHGLATGLQRDLVRVLHQRHAVLVEREALFVHRHAQEEGLLRLEGKCVGAELASASAHTGTHTARHATDTHGRVTTHVRVHACWAPSRTNTNSEGSWLLWHALLGSGPRLLLPVRDANAVMLDDGAEVDHHVLRHLAGRARRGVRRR